MGKRISKATRSAPGWRFDRTAKKWCCDQHGSPTCTVCARPELKPGTTETWWIDADGIAMPEPKPGDCLPEETQIASRSEADRMPHAEIVVDMTSRDVADITSMVAAFSSAHGDGLVNVLLCHATAGIALIELGRGTERDVIAHLERLAPQEDVYVNDCGRGDEGSDHLLPVLLCPSLTLPVMDGKIRMSPTQRIVVVDRFYPMQRHVLLSFVGGRP